MVVDGVGTREGGGGRLGGGVAGGGAFQAAGGRRRPCSQLELELLPELCPASRMCLQACQHTTSIMEQQVTTLSVLNYYHHLA